MLGDISCISYSKIPRVNKDMMMMMMICEHNNSDFFVKHNSENSVAYCGTPALKSKCSLDKRDFKSQNGTFSSLRISNIPVRFQLSLFVKSLYIDNVYPFII